MAEPGEQSPNQRKRIVVTKDGPYVVYGNVPLVYKTQIVSEYGEPLTWKTGEAIPAPEVYQLCRCGHTTFKPFCDYTHGLVGFDGTETADTKPTTERQITFPGTNIVVRRDYTICSESGFCANRRATVEEMVPHTDDTEVRSLVMAMIERCPSGSFVYTIHEGEDDVEPDYPQEIAVTIEITSDGPIDGPLWVTGNIAIERADGQPFETRNRVTLCRCGRSKIMPLCDGTHRPPDMPKHGIQP
jgi:CDGSH-type Zn-finger protein